MAQLKSRKDFASRGDAETPRKARTEVILDSDPNIRADFEERILKKYFDFSRFRAQYLREACHAPL